MDRVENSAFVKVVLHLTYFLTGIATVLIGQVLPVMAGRFSLGDLELSYFFPAQFGGSLTGSLAASWFGHRNKYFAATILGLFLIVCGILLMNVPTLGVCLAGFCINGLGIGLTLQPINMSSVEMAFASLEKTSVKAGAASLRAI